MRFTCERWQIFEPHTLIGMPTGATFSNRRVFDGPRNAEPLSGCRLGLKFILCRFARHGGRRFYDQR